MTYLKISLLSFMAVLFFSLNGLKAQPIPNYELSIRNPILSGTTYQFDIYLKQLGTANFRLGNSQFILTMNAAAFSSPAIAKLPSSEQIGSGYFYDQKIAKGNEIRIALGGNGSYALATDIASTGEGTRIATYQITGVNVSVVSPSLTWINLPTIIRTGISEIDASDNCRNITDPTGASHLNGGGEFARLSGYVFNDLDGNGVWNQPPEYGLNGWTMTITGSSGPYAAVTGNGVWPPGYFEFDNLTPGNYTLAETPQVGWYPTVSPSNPIVLAPSQFSQNNLFGNYNGPSPYGIDVSTVSDNSGFNGRIVFTSFSVQNTGNLMDSISFHVRDNRGWVMTPADSGFVLSKNQLVNVNIWTTISGVDPAGTVDTIWLTGTSYSDPATKDSSFATVTVLSITGSETCHMADGWNMVSVPVKVSDYRKKTLFPDAISSAFSYKGSYVGADTLDTCQGYWLKYSGAHDVSIPGVFDDNDSLDVDLRWNMIGGISYPIATDEIIQRPDGIVTSSFYGYNGTYQAADSIKPGYAYWVKVNARGRLVFQYRKGSAVSKQARIDNTLLQKSNSLIISDPEGNTQVLHFGPMDLVGQDLSHFDAPPPSPGEGLDVRFTSQRYFERYSSGSSQLKIDVRGRSYPLTVRWKILDTHARIRIMSDAGLSQDINHPAGTLTIGSPTHRMTLAIKSWDASKIPIAYILEQNYPNPFNPNTTFRYQLPSDSRVTLRVYDLLGQIVATLVDHPESAGYKSIDWNATTFASGIYFYQLEAASISDPSKTFTQVKKMVLNK